MANQFESMFDTLGQTKMGPTPEEFKKQMEEAQRKSKVIFKSYNAKMFVLSDHKQVEEYTKLMFILVEGMNKCTHVTFKMDRQFVPNHPGGPTWMVYIEWGEYELVEIVFQSIPSANVLSEVKDVKEDKQIGADDPLSA